MKKNIISIFLIWVFLFVFVQPVLATSATGSPSPSPMPSPVPDPDDTHTLYQYLLYTNDESGNLLYLKGLLNKKGYFTNPSADQDVKSNFFDTNTLIAINAVCRRMGLPWSDYGIYSESFYALRDHPENIPMIDATLPPTPTPGPNEIYIDIPPNTTQSDYPMISTLQKHLRDLGYDTDSKGNLFALTPGTYDLAMRDMLLSYCELNNIPWSEISDNFTITALMQETIMNDSRQRREVVEEQEDVKESGLLGYFFKKVTLFGIEMYNYVVWLISFALIAVIVLLCVFFFSPKQAPVSGGGHQTLSKYRRSNQIEFIISYDGNEKSYIGSIDHTLKIGRNIGNFPLDLSDRKISKKHCEIYYSGKMLMIRDYSSNGTFVNGKPCNHGEYVLHNNDVITIGDHRITIKFKG